MGDKILLIAPRELGRELAAQLSGWGHISLFAADAEEALDLAFRHKPAISILDDGSDTGEALELVRRFKAEHPWTETIFLADLAEIERGARALEFGASDYLIKPVSPHRLGVALRRAQDRLVVRKKLAYLSGHIPNGGLPAALPPLGEETTRAARLYDTLQQYQQLFDEVPCYISVLDHNFTITATNRRFKEEFGELVGKTCHDVYQGRCEGCPDCPVADTFVDGQSHQYEQVLRAQDGRRFNVLTWTAPLRDAQGEINQVMVMSTDITQIRKLQDHLSSLGMVISSISHGVKGLLTALDGGMYKVRAGLERGDMDRVSKGWELVERMTERIRRTVLDILYYAKERELDTEQVEVAEFAKGVAVAGEYAAKKHGLDFKLVLAPDLGRFEVDPNALNPAMINILENAVDACLDDDEEKPHRRILFQVSREDDVLVFDIVDNGKGMDHETLENMFTLFFTSKGSAGTGLGLFIANDTVQQHGGSITVDSEPGEGSHFHVRIPEHPMAMPWERAPGPLKSKNLPF
ncbi:MAG: PAS domain-containing protein [Desulfarculus sp.]|nr:PAS domain-containing protein [Pseudomonadota bacterium]MBV1716876.1 PAS domain-containing protein [Desulfarculus sp.]MBU4576903.1 PAS domain-containing protein [Pseudomonadota bacterium]MBU4598932.1 PAS domain-containing protein [Pseudomonadota bacterium]MBV1738379.1 PAS domain-containing protein [Desulfarculus sp.]